MRNELPKHRVAQNVYSMERYGSRTVIARFDWAGERFFKSFGFSKYGSRARAIKAATDWRDTTYRRLMKPLTNRRVMIRGQMGVFRWTPRSKRRQGGSRWVAAFCLRPGRLVTRTFGVGTHGERRAFQLALAARQDAELKMYGQTLPRGKSATRRLGRELMA